MKKNYFLVLLAFIIAPLAIYAQPVNDNCSGAFEIIVDGPVVTVDNTESTIDGDPGSCYFFGVQESGDVWYTFTTTETLNLRVNTVAGTITDSQIAIYTIDDCGTGTEVYTEIACDEDGGDGLMSTITILDLPADTYYLKAGNYDDETFMGTFEMSIVSLLPAENDNCATATEIIVDGAAATADNTVSTVYGPVGSCFTDQTAGDVWYTFTTTEDLNLQIATEEGTSFDTRLTLYTITDCGGAAEEFTEIACTDNLGFSLLASMMLLDVPAGTYFIKAGTSNTNTGDFNISVTSFTPPDNNTCAGAIELIVDGPSEIADNSSATISGPEASCNLTAQVVGDTWFTFTTTEIMNIQVITEAGVSTDSQIAVFTIDACGTVDEAYVEIACDDDGGDGFMSSALIIDLVPGTYYIKAGTYGSGNTGSYSVSVINFGDIPAHVNCMEAVVQVLTIDGETVSVEGSGTNAIDFEGMGLAHVWEAFTITDCADVTIDMCGTPIVPLNYYISVTQDCPVGPESTFENSLFYNTDSCGDGNMTATFMGLEAGTYFYPVMSSPDYTVLDEYTINFTAVTCAPEPDTCLYYAAEELTFFAGLGGAPSPDETGVCESVSMGFGSWASESYLIENFSADVSYTFSMCDGPSAGNWEPAISVVDPNGNLVAYAEGCTVSWTTEIAGTYVIGVSELGHCYDSGFTSTDGGIPTLTCEGNVGIEEADLADFSIFPNPNNGQFSIRNSGLAGEYAIEMIDLSGRTIHKQLSLLNSNNVTEINNDKVAPGVYMIRMINTKDNSSVTKRIVVQ